MPVPETLSTLKPFTDQDKIDAEFEAIDIESRRAADFVVNMAGVIEDLRRHHRA